MAYYSRPSESGFSNNGRVIDTPAVESISSDYLAIPLDPEFGKFTPKIRMLKIFWKCHFSLNFAMMLVN